MFFFTINIMKKIFLSLLPLTMITAYAQTDFANLKRYEQENAIIFQNNQPVSFVFIGDSITEGWKNTDPEFWTKNNYIDRGISGQTTPQMVLRFQQDVVQLKPKAVIIMAGTNDIAQNTGPITHEQIFNNLKSMAELARFHKIKVIFCSVLPAYDFGWKKGLAPAEKIIALNKMIQNYCKENHLTYVDYHSALKDERNGLPSKYSEDEVHPTLEAYKIMEKIIQPYLK